MKHWLGIYGGNHLMILPPTVRQSSVKQIICQQLCQPISESRQLRRLYTHEGPEILAEVIKSSVYHLKNNISGVRAVMTSAVRAHSGYPRRLHAAKIPQEAPPFVESPPAARYNGGGRPAAGRGVLKRDTAL